MADRVLSNYRIEGHLGLGTDGDASNKLAVKGAGSLFDNAGAGHQIKVNKAAAGDTGSFLFQTGFSGRAEFGLLGNNDFTLKTSANGSAWFDAFAVGAGTGVLDFKQMPTFLGNDMRSNISDAIFSLADNADATKRLAFQLSGITTGVTRTLTVPDVDSTIAVLTGVAQTFQNTTTFSGPTVTVGTSTATSTYGLGTGATLSGNTKTINIGTAGVSGSTTVVNVGSPVAGALGSLVVNSPTVTFASSVTAIGAAAANISALRLGIGGATADATNQLSVNTPSVLLNRGTDDINVTLNKQAAADDARFTFQTNFSTRALFGTLGADDFALQVSPDGSSFFPAFTALAANGDLTNVAVRSDFLIRDNTDRTKAAQFVVSGITTGTTRAFTLPNFNGTLMVTDQNQTVSGAITFSNTTFNAAAATTASLATAATATTVNLGSGVTTTGVTKTVNLGTGGASGSTTNINIGSTTAGALGTTTLGSPTVTFGTTNTTISILGTTALTGTGTNATLQYMGLGGATADATNRLSVNTPAILFNHAGTSIEATFNKNAAANDAAFAFKTGFTSYALLGLLGDNNFTIKVGTGFTTAMTIDNTNGKVSFPAGIKQLHVGTTAPASPAVGDLWVDTN
ncbi:hypothetical protein RCZAHN_39 [Rhodobacter phage RcZahn]|nr:hypothetical protein RCZAHN_39 [Rhodobacter phage RcZahn]